MNCLAIDTSGATLVAALISGEKNFTRTVNVGKSGHSRILMGEIDALLNDGGIAVEDLDAVAVTVGPGSFTGIRIGVATATALAFALKTKRISVTSFDIIAYNRSNVTAAVDAGHGNLYVAEFRDGRQIAESFVTAEEPKPDAEFEPVVDAATALVGVVRRKIDAGEYVERFEPYYMRKSQAEREKDDV